MARRGYLDFTPQELRARRIAFFGLALFLMPPLLTLCHLEQFVCRAGWRIEVASLITLWSLFPWMVLVAVIMLCGLAILTMGGVLLLLEKRQGMRHAMRLERRREHSDDPDWLARQPRV